MQYLEAVLVVGILAMAAISWRSHGLGVAAFWLILGALVWGAVLLIGAVI